MAVTFPGGPKYELIALKNQLNALYSEPGSTKPSLVSAGKLNPELQGKADALNAQIAALQAKIQQDGGEF